MHIARDRSFALLLLLATGAGACAGPGRERAKHLALLDRPAGRETVIRFGSPHRAHHLRIPVRLESIPDIARRSAQSILGEGAPGEIQAFAVWSEGSRTGWRCESSPSPGRRWVLVDAGGDVLERGHELRGSERAEVLSKIRAQDVRGVRTVFFVEGGAADGYLLERRVARPERATGTADVLTWVPLGYGSPIQAKDQWLRVPAEAHFAIDDEFVSPR